MITELETTSIQAWPALETRHYDGWVLRFADGYTRRSNSINAIYKSSLPLAQKIDFVENAYHSRQLPVIFKMTDAVHPNDLDAALHMRGYKRASGADVKTCDLTTMVLETHEGVRFETHLTDEWLSTFMHMNAVSHHHQKTMQIMLSQIVPATCFAALYQADKIIALGLGIMDGAYMGLFDIVTSTAHRRRGVGTAIVRSLLHWGQQQGATQAYLQVADGNMPAVKLYQRIGFKTVYTYWYRELEL